MQAAAFVDGSWSIANQINTELFGRRWDAPYPYGSIGQWSTRILYGFSWTMMLGLEGMAVIAAADGKFDWLGDAAYRTDWVVPVDLPTCTHPGAFGGCGVGGGSFSLLQVRPLRSQWWFEAGGGWFEQRVANDQYRTLVESSWVLTPISVFRELRTPLDAPVAFRFFFGPGVYFGMHNAHLHPTNRGKRQVYKDVPITEMYPLDAGIGPGGRVEARLIFAQHLSLEGELIVAPFLAGGPTSHVSHDVAPLDFERQGWSVWRKASAGIGWEDPAFMPFKVTLEVFGAELSDRPVERIGYRGGMVRFDIPLKVPRGE